MTFLIVALLIMGPSQVGNVEPPVAVAGAAAIKGRVLAEGRPLFRAQVRLAGLQQRLTTTADDGSYEFTNLPAGSFRLFASKTGFAALEFGQRRAFESGQPVVLGAGERRERVDIVLFRHGAIAGRIVDEGGDPVQGAIVSVLQTRFVNGRRQLVAVSGAAGLRTNDLGRYRIYGLQPGRYWVRAETGAIGTGDLPGYAPTFFPGTANPADAWAVTVDLSERIANVDFALASITTATIAGITMDSAGERFQGRIQMRPSRRSTAVDVAAVGARTYADGRFEFRNVPPGEYVIDAFKGEEHGLQFVSVNGTDIADLTVQTRPGSTISGQITFEGGDAPPRADLLLTPVAVDPDLVPFSAPRDAEISRNWAFEIRHVIGPRRLHVVRAPAGWTLKRIFVDGQDATDEVLSFGTPAQSVKKVEVILTNQLTELSGTLAANRGPVADHAVMVFATDRRRWYSRSRFLILARSQADGRFTVRGLPPDEYFVAAIDRVPGNDADGEWADPEFLDGLVRGAQRITLAEGQHLSINLTLLPR